MRMRRMMAPSPWRRDISARAAPVDLGVVAELGRLDQAGPGPLSGVEAVVDGLAAGEFGAGPGRGEELVGVALGAMDRMLAQRACLDPLVDRPSRYVWVAVEVGFSQVPKGYGAV